jgi:hypothetical protein
VKVRVRAAGPAPSPQAVIEAILMEALPLTEESRTFHLAYESYAVLAMTDPALNVGSQVRSSDLVELTITGQLIAAQEECGRLPALTPEPRRLACSPCPPAWGPAACSASAQPLTRRASCVTTSTACYPDRPAAVDTKELPSVGTRIARA